MYIDKTGKEVIPLQYDSAFDFYNGRARVIQDDKYGFIVNPLRKSKN
ncbi:WG repeat-containing protein [Cohnella panacarvi]|nr:WG repeat-containing protein [Cohnella panacarvi]